MTFCRRKNAKVRRDKGFAFNLACRATPPLATLAFCAALTLPTSSLRAESLIEALASAYLTNPTLNASRAELRATDEEVPRAKSGFRPTITGEYTKSYQKTETKREAGSTFASSDGEVYPESYSVSLNQPLFRGFRTLNSVKQAEANVRASRETLRLTEQSTLLNGVTAYMNVVRDQAIVRLRQNNVNVLSEQLKATQDRFKVGEVTKTDVAQARARRAGAVSQLNLANANLKTSRANYRRIIGHEPRRLAQPKSIDRLLPRSLSEAIDIALAENPTIGSSVYREKAARHAINTIRGEFLPEVNLQASYQKQIDPSVLINEQETTTVTANVRVPLYQAGEVSARVRQSKQTYQQRRDQIVEATDTVRSEIVSAWGQLEATRAQLISDQAQVDANRTALTGVKEEEKVGQRTILDVLDAEQELLDSQVDLVTTRRDNIVAAFSVLSALGRLTAGDLGLPVAYYDPEDHYRKVRRKIFGTGVHVPSNEHRELQMKNDHHQKSYK